MKLYAITNGYRHRLVAAPDPETARQRCAEDDRFLHPRAWLSPATIVSEFPGTIHSHSYVLYRVDTDKEPTNG